MPVPSSLSLKVNLEFIRKEAKALLKLCRLRNHEALARIRVALPQFAALDDERAAAAIKLADIQYALARESGFLSWRDLKEQGQQLMPDFSQPGHDGEALPEGFNPWRACLSYTVRPEIVAPLVYGREYRVFVRVLGKAPRNEPFTEYAPLYAHAMAIAKGRVARLKCSRDGQVLHSRILAQGWFRHEPIDAATAILTLGVVCLNSGDPALTGEPEPAAEELTAPGGYTPEKFPVPPTTLNIALDESYTCGYPRDPSETTHKIFLVSYGEYVPACEGIDYEPFVERAENLARFHRPFLGPGWAAAKIIRREWFCATNPDIAVVHVFLQTA